MLAEEDAQVGSRRGNTRMNPGGRVTRLLGALMLLLASGAHGQGALDQSSVQITPARENENGIASHRVTSPYQAKPTQIRVLLPDSMPSDRPYPVVYVLPVEGGLPEHYGNGMVEVRRRDLHNKHNAIFVGPTFSALPWYANHPTQQTRQQERYFLEVVQPFVEKRYPVQSEPEEQLLLGFSKSGWGAWSLLLRHPDRFGRAAAWDAPLTMQTVGQYGNKQIFATQANFNAYRITDLLRQQRDPLRHKPRLILTGYHYFRGQHRQIHSLLKELGIPHVYRDGPKRAHDWHSGWVAPTVELLLKPAKAKRGP